MIFFYVACSFRICTVMNLHNFLSLIAVGDLTHTIPQVCYSFTQVRQIGYSLFPSDTFTFNNTFLCVSISPSHYVHETFQVSFPNPKHMSFSFPFSLKCPRCSHTLFMLFSLSSRSTTFLLSQVSSSYAIILFSNSTLYETIGSI